MKNLFLMGLAVGVLTFASCDKNKDSFATDDSFDKRSTEADYSGYPTAVQTVSGNITSNTTWTSDIVWEISGVVVVKSGATLTIQPGTFIKSTVNTPGTPNGVLVIQRGAKINAIGTRTSPIVFTSRNLLDGNTTRKPEPGDFGGIVLLGNAPVNVRGRTIEGLPPIPEYTFGGSNSADNSGTMQYVRIEYGGFNLSSNNEVNGLTLGGVGSGTVLDYIQVSYSKDDGFQFFGGTVNASHLVALGSDDDQFDFINGYRGTIQYAVAVADGTSSHSTTDFGESDSNGIELGNNDPADDASFSLTPKTRPTLRNFSVVGTRMWAVAIGVGYKYGVRHRRGAEIDMQASLITGFPSGFVFDGTAPASSVLTNNSAHGFTAAITPAVSGNSMLTGAQAQGFGMTQPWFNMNPNVNFLSSGTRGAAITASGTYWLFGWTKFVF